MNLVKNIFLFFCIYKMYLRSAEGYKNAGIDLLIIKKTVDIDTLKSDQNTFTFPRKSTE